MVDRHADIVADKAKLRRLIDAAGVITDEAYSERDDVEDITDNAEKTILAVTRDDRRSDTSAVEQSSLCTSCSRDISSEKKATCLCAEEMLMFFAIFSTKAVLPMDGRAATMTKSPF